MNISSLQENTALHFLDVLNAHNCPFTQDVEASYMCELLLSPGEHRIRLLLWIFGQIHPNVEKIVNAQDIIMRQESDLGVDKRIQLLTSLASTFGLCRPEDLDLIRGHASHSKQVSFWRKLFDIIQPAGNVTHEADNGIMDILTHPGRNLIHHSTSEQLEILPHNLKKEMTMMLSNQKKSKIGFESIEVEFEKLQESLDVQKNRLEEIMKDAKYIKDDDETAQCSVACKLSLTLNDLDQMLTTFDQVFTNNFLPYCNRHKDEFGNLGPVVQIVNKQLTYVVQNFENLQSIQRSNDMTVKCLEKWPKIKQKVSQFAPVFESFLFNSLHCLDNLAHTINMDQDSAQNSFLVLGDESHSVNKLHETISEISKIK